MTFFLADHQLGVYPLLVDNLAHPDRLLNSDTAVRLTVSNGKWDRNVGRVVDG